MACTAALPPRPGSHRLALYTFYPRTAAGLSLTFEVFELTSDEQARTIGKAVMRRHDTCSAVVVWDGERHVLEMTADQAEVADPD